MEIQIIRRSFTFTGKYYRDNCFHTYEKCIMEYTHFADTGNYINVDICYSRENI